MRIKGVILFLPTDDVGLLTESLVPTSSVLVGVGHGSLSCNRFKGRRLQVDNWSGLLEIAALIGDINPEMEAMRASAGSMSPLLAGDLGAKPAGRNGYRFYQRIRDEIKLQAGDGVVLGGTPPPP